MELSLFAWILGTWKSKDSQESWASFGTRSWGVGFFASDEGVPFEVLSLSRQGDAVVYTARPGGRVEVPFTAATATRFQNPAHDFPQTVTYVPGRRGRLDAWLGTMEEPRTMRLRLARHELPPAPALEEADRAWCVSVAQGGTAAWVAGFDAEGFQWDGKVVPAGPEMVAMMAPQLEGGQLTWTPTASGLSPWHKLGFTMGTWTWTGPEDASARGSYVTVWRQQADGSWKVLFDTGAADGA